MSEFYFHSAQFMGERGEFWRERPLPYKLDLHSNFPLSHAAFIETSNRMVYRRRGVLRGEYVLLPDAALLINKDGCCIKISVDYYNMANAHLDSAIATPGFQATIQDILARWDSFPLSESAPIISDINQNNYGHFTTDVLLRIKLFSDLEFPYYIIPEAILKKSYQKDLLARCLQGRKVFPLTQIIRVKDPLVGKECPSLDFIKWLRETTKLSVPSGPNRYYIGRGQAVSRAGGGVSETPELVELLKRYDFKFVDFADGFDTMEDEMAVVSGAAVVLSSHGTNLTNLLYMNAPLSVIEVIGSRECGAEFFDYSHRLGFDHHIIASQDYDQDGNIVIDCAVLEGILKAVL